MKFSFKQYCESQDATAHYQTPPLSGDATAHYSNTPDSGFTNRENKSFEQVVDPLIDNFTNKILGDVLSQGVSQLQPIQIQYILNKLNSQLSRIHYDPNNDIGNMVSTLFKQGNQPKTPMNTPKTR